MNLKTMMSLQYQTNPPRVECRVCGYALYKGEGGDQYVFEGQEGQCLNCQRWDDDRWAFAVQLQIKKLIPPQ